MMLDLYNYHCPCCGERLNYNNEVEFNVRRHTGEEVKLYLSPAPHTYQTRSIPPVEFEMNEEVDFFCPHCEESIVSEEYDKYVKIHLKITDKVLIDVFFSRVYGVQKTYVGVEDFKETYGREMASI